MNKTTVEKIQLKDGKEVELMVNFAALYKLRTINKSLYDKYNKVLMKGSEDVLELLPVVYAGYVCANIDNAASCMSEKEFTDLIPFEPVNVMHICRGLLGNAKK